MESHHPQLTDLFKRRQKAEGPAPSTQTVDWSPLINLCAGHYRAEHRAELQRDTSAELWQAYTQASIAQNASNGDKRLHDLREALCHLDKKYNRSAHQRSFHDAFIASCIRNARPKLSSKLFVLRHDVCWRARRSTRTSTARTTCAF